MRKTALLVASMAAASGLAISAGLFLSSAFPPSTDAAVTTHMLTSTADTKIVEHSPTANRGDFTSLGADGDTPSGSGKGEAALINWDLSGIAPGTPVGSASLALSVTDSSPQTYEVYRLKREWTESEVTWNESASGEPWELPGAKGSLDRGTAQRGIITPSATGERTFILSPKLVQRWVDKPASNRGIVIVDSGNSNGFDFHSGEAATESRRPRLTVELGSDQHTVVPTVETTPVSHSGDAADDAAIWVDPSDPARSTIVGTDKLGGIAVYDLAGTQLQYRDENARYNNVDVRPDFPLGDQRVALVAASDRTRYYTSDQTQYHRRIVLYSVDPATGTLTDPVGTIRADFEPYGLCMYRSQTSGRFYVFVTGRNPVGDLDGYVEQWELSDNGRGQIDAEKVRSFGVGSLTEGCVADNEMGHLYLAEEDVGIWKYPAEPDEELARLLVDAAGPEGHLVADVEGLAIAYGPNGKGYLLASSQGNSSYTVYRREGSNAYLQTFTVVNGGDTDGTTDTDGIDVSTASLGSSFPSGLFVAQDGTNTTPSGTAENQNYKLVPFQHILEP